MEREMKEDTFIKLANLGFFPSILFLLQHSHVGIGIINTLLEEG